MDNPNIITLTLNPAVDHILAVDTLSLYNKNQVKLAFTFHGGKGINVAYALGKLGARCSAAGFIGKGDLSPLQQKLASVSVSASFVPIHGETRANLKIMDMAAGQDTEFNQPGFTIQASDLQRLDALLSKVFHAGDWLAVSGSLPPGAPDDYYAHIISQAHQAGMKTCLDASGAALRAGVAAKPILLRINLSEMEELLGRQLNEITQIVPGMHELLAGGIGMAVISMGKRGVIGSNGRQIVRAIVPAVNVASLTGAGDTLTAGCLHGLARGDSFSQMLRFASALATASTLKMEPGDFNAQDLSRILEQTRLEAL